MKLVNLTAIAALAIITLSCGGNSKPADEQVAKPDTIAAQPEPEPKEELDEQPADLKELLNDLNTQEGDANDTTATE